MRVPVSGPSKSSRPLAPIRITSVDGDKTAQALVKIPWFLSVLDFLSDANEACRAKVRKLY